MAPHPDPRASSSTLCINSCARPRRRHSAATSSVTTYPTYPPSTACTCTTQNPASPSSFAITTRAFPVSATPRIIARENLNSGAKHASSSRNIASKSLALYPRNSITSPPVALIFFCHSRERSRMGTCSCRHREAYTATVKLSSLRVTARYNVSRSNGTLPASVISRTKS